MIQLKSDGVRWELQASFVPLLKEALDSPGEVVKESPAKLVTVHNAAGRTFYIKRYRHASVPLRPLKFFLKASQARQEWAIAQRLESVGLPIVSHLALGERWEAGLQESILITEGFAGKSLDQTRHPNPAAVVEFVRRMHERGVLQKDLHAGNILLSASGEMRLVDLHGTIIKASLSAAERQTNLARLRVSCSLPVAAEVETLSVQMRRKLLRSRSRRCLRHNREFAPQRVGGMKWWVRLPLLSPGVQEILSDPDGVLKGRAQILKGGRTSTVGRVHGVVLKRFNLRKMTSLVKNLFRASRARRAFRAAYHLELLGIPTARPIAAADHRLCGILLRSYLLIEEIASAAHLGAYLNGRCAPESKVVDQVAQLIARLHEEGFSHRDLKETNLVVGADDRVYLIDLDGMNYRGEVPDSRAAADLERLARGMDRYSAVTRAHRRRFLKVYCRTRKRTSVPRLD